MCLTSEVSIGTIAIVKVGCNEVEVTVTEITANGWKVKSQSSGREFEVRKIERIVSETPKAPEATPELEAAPAPVCPPAEAGAVKEKTERKPSLINAAARVLEASGEPMNCKEMLAAAIAEGLWSPSGAKTPEQTLYSAIFREIKSCEKPRFRKSAKKGAFEFVSEA